ncbi:MAG: DUF6067 family protein [Armatimonadota bacterium]|nr:DUF6067 family protein [Armatimonadota bacterium]
MTRYVVLAAVTALVLLALGQATAPAQTIAPEAGEWYGQTRNGGFEAGGELPEFWHRFPPQEQEWGICRRDTEDAHSGEASGLLVSEAKHPPGKAPVQWNRYGLPVEGGTSLLVSYWVKSDGRWEGRAGAHFYDADGNHLGYETLDPRQDTTEWTHVQGLIPVPERAATMGFALYGADEQTTRYDDVVCLGTPSVEAVRAAPRLDGVLDDGCWPDERAITQFIVHTGERLPTSQPRAWIAYDDEALYVAFQCPHPGGADLKADATEHDGDTWLDDSIEVFLDPWHEHDDYYQLCVNCLGVIRDTHRKDTAWESGATASVQRRDDRWTVELAIPFDALGLDMRVGESWGINLVRNDRVRGETSTWSLEAFHRPERFGNVAMSPNVTRYKLAALARRLPELQRRLAALQADVGPLRLAEDARAAVEQQLAAAKAALTRLGEAAAEPRRLSEDEWGSLHESYASIDTALREARTMALQGVLRSGPEGFGVAIAGPLHKIRREGEETEGILADHVEMTAARDEAESFQLVVVAGQQALSGVEVQAPPLRGEGGQIPLTWRIVDYVETADPGYDAEYVGWWPDPLLPGAPFDVEAGQRQPVWFTVEVPPDAAPGEYSTEVTVSHGQQSVSVPVSLRVRSFRLPRPGTLATAFGLYAGGLARWWWEGKPYEEHMPIEMFRDWCEFMGRYRLTPKNIAREYLSRGTGFYRTDIEPGKPITVDMSNLQKTVAPLASEYFAPYSFCLHRLPTAGSMDNSAQGTDPEVAAAMCKAYAEEWERQGLPREVYIYGYDEPKPDHYPQLVANYRAIKQAVPDYPIMQTISDPEPEELVGLVDIWCPLSPRVLGDFYRQRRRAGDTLWMYTCCGPKPPHANFFVDEPAIDHRILFWQARQAGATGFLYWFVAYWTGLPNASGDQPHFPDVPIHMRDLGTYERYKDNGDGVLLWPGRDRQPLASIRLECIRDGIEDYEYLGILSRLVERAEQLSADERPDGHLLAEAEALCIVPEEISESMTSFTKNPQVLLDRREAVGDMIERLGEAIAAE